MAKIIVHIGLPKTATTSLQVDYFTHLNKNKIKYLGIKHPRKNKQNKLYTQFIQALTTGKKINETKTILEAELQKGYDLLLSEEMIVVGDWQTKITNLNHIIKELEHIIIVTVREPATAMFSYYTELYHIFRKENKPFTELALLNNYMKIYHYKYFFQFLLKYFELSQIRVYSFENIINNKLGELNDLVHIPYETKLQKHNSKRNESSYIIKEQKLSAISQLAKILSIIKLKSIFQFSIFKPLKTMVIYFLMPFNFKKVYKVKKPNESELNELRKALTDETSFIQQKFEIYYL